MSFRTTAAARQKEMNASIAVEAISTRFAPAGATYGFDFIRTSFTFDPHHLMTNLPKPRSQPLLARSPPRPLDRDHHKRARAQRPAESLLPISRVDDLRRDRKSAFPREVPDSASEVKWVNGGLVQGNAVWNNVHVDQPQMHVEIVRQSRG